MRSIRRRRRRARTHSNSKYRQLSFEFEFDRGNPVGLLLGSEFYAYRSGIQVGNDFR